MHTVVQLVWVTFLLVLYCSEHNAHKENFDKHDAKINQNTLKSFFSCLKRSWHPDVFFFFFRLKKNMKIELTVHLGTLLTHTVHRYAQFSLSYSYILGLKKTWAFLYGEVCRKLKVIPPSPSYGTHYSPPSKRGSSPVQAMLSCSANQSPSGQLGASKSQQTRKFPSNDCSRMGRRLVNGGVGLPHLLQ